MMPRSAKRAMLTNKFVNKNKDAANNSYELTGPSSFYPINSTEWYKQSVYA